MSAAAIMKYYDNHPNITLWQLSLKTGKSVAYLKGLLLA